MTPHPTCHRITRQSLTFLFTDVVGSTAAWEREPGSMGEAMARHDALVEAVVTEHGGSLVRPRGEGDSRFAVFTDPAGALRAGAALPGRLASEPWPTAQPVVVRCALHTGGAQLRDGDYYGSAVNRCARLRSIANPGQVLASEVTVELVAPGGAPVALTDLGIHWLKDLEHPERAFQVTPLGAAVPQFAPLRSQAPPLGRVAPLPSPAAELIGRDADVDALVDLVTSPSTSLVTVTGPGGVGKTRVALEAAHRAADAFLGGASFVDLAPVADADAVVAEIAAALGVADRGDGSLGDALAERLSQVPSLLVLDNVEQVVGAAKAIGDLAQVAPLTVLTTSRVPLRVRGEAEHRLDALAIGPAVELFAARAQGHRPGFEVTADNEAAVREICARLDGLPLALELAAARLRLLQPDQLLERLAQSLQVLVGGERDAPDRQRTLRATIGWSYDLLDADHRLLLTRLSTFAGSFSLESASEVAGGDGLESDVLDLLGDLVDQSLCRVREAGSHLRFDLLQSIREFVADQVADDGARQELRRRHARRLLAIAEQAGSLLDQPDAAAAMAELRTEEPDLRLAATTLRDADRAGAARLALALQPFWITQGRLGEGRQLVTAVLAGGDLEPRFRARLLLEAGILAWYQDAVEEAEPLLAEAATGARSAGDGETATIADCFLAAVTLATEGVAAAGPLARSALAAARDGGWYQALVQSLSLSAILAGVSGDAEREEALHRERLELTRARGDRARTADTLNTLAEIRLDLDDPDGARASAAEALELARGTSRLTVRDALVTLARLSLRDGDVVAAASALRQALDLSVEFAQPFELALCMRGAGAAAVVAGERTTAARLAGAAEALRDPDGDPFPLEPDLEAVLGAIDDDDPDRIAGRALSRLDALATATALLDRLGGPEAGSGS